MARLFRKRSKKIGTPPGSLIYTGEEISKTTEFSLLLYDETSLVQKHPRTIEEALESCKGGQKIWLHVTGVSDPHVIGTIGKFFKLHPLLLEDTMSPSQRSKLDDYRESIYIATHILQFSPASESTLDDQQLSIILGDRFLITLTEKQTDVLNPIRERLNKPSSKMRQRGSDYLAYAILDSVVDHYFLSLAHVDQSLENLEDELLTEPTATTISNIQKIKREMALMRKTIWPMREIINRFRRSDSPLLEESTQVFAYDVYDHTVQAIETVESFRDITSGMIDIYLSTMNQKMNEVMKLLTIVATIFVPLTFITSLYGMNFTNMPELNSAYGYPFVLLFMALTAIAMLWYFKRKHWF